MDDKMKTGSRTQHEKSERVSTGEQQTDLETLYSKQTSKIKSIKKNPNKKTSENNKNVEQSINQRLHKNAKEKVIEQSNKGNAKEI
jgi:hypothetical protein